MSHAYHSTGESLWIAVALLFAALVYLRRWLRIAWLVPNGIKAWRACSFWAGLLLVWVALGSPLSFLDHDLLTVHMVQHLLLMTLAPPLILLGSPWKVLPQTAEQRVVALIARLHPTVGWIGATAALLMWHLPGIFMIGLRYGLWHGIEQASFLLTGLLFWWPVVDPSRNVAKWPESSMILYLFLATLPCDILSGFLVFCDRVVYPVYLSSPSRFGLTALEDQQCAGALMWTCVTIVYLIAGSIFAARLLSPRWSQERLILRPEPQAIAVAHREENRMEVV
jgi:putative membrane protein